MSVTLELAGVDNLSGALQSIQAELKGLSDEAQSSSSLISAAFATVTTAATLLTGAVTAAGAASLYFANQFQQTMSLVEGLTGTAHAEVEQFKQSILDMGSSLPQSANELGRALYFIESSGIHGAAGMDVLTASARAAAGGLGSTVEVADAVTSTLNAYKMGAEQSAHITDVLVKAVLEGKSEASAFAGSLGRVLPIASMLGVSFEQVTASMATMTRIGLNADEAATALRGALSALAAPGKQARDAMEAVGTSAVQLRQSIAEKGLLATLQDLMVKTGGNIEVLKLIIPNIRALTGVLATAGAQGEEYAKVLDSINHATGATDKAFEVASKNINFQLSTIKNQLVNTGIQIAQSFQPGISALLQSLNSGLGSALSTIKDWGKQAGDVFSRAMSEMLAGLKGGGLTGAASGLLHALGFGPEFITQVTSTMTKVKEQFDGLVKAIQDGYARVKDAAAQGFGAFQSGGAGAGASAFLKALGLDGTVADQVKSAIDGIIAAARDAVSRLAQAINLDAVGNAFLSLASIISQHTGAIVGGLAAITTAFLVFQGAISLAGIITGIAEALFFLTTPVGLVAGAVTAIGVAGVALGAILLAVGLDIGGVNERLSSMSPILGGVVSVLQFAADMAGRLIGQFTGLYGSVVAITQAVQVFAVPLALVGEYLLYAINPLSILGQLMGVSLVQFLQAGDSTTQYSIATNLAKDAVEGLKNALLFMVNPLGTAINQLGVAAKASLEFARAHGWVSQSAEEMGASLQRAAENGDRYWEHTVDAANRGILDILKAFASGKITMTEAMREIMDSVHKASVDGFNKILSSARVAAAQYAAILKTMSFNAEVVGGAGVDATNMENRADLKALKSPISPSEWSTIQGALAQQKAEADRAAAAAKAAADAQNGFGGALGGLGDSGINAGKNAGKAKKSAEEMAQQAANALKDIVESITKMQEFLDQGYGALVEGDGAAKITELSQHLFDLGRVFAEQLVKATEDLDLKFEVIGKSVVDLTDKGATAIQHAASALTAMVGLLPKMWEFKDTEAYAALVNSPQIYVEMGQHLIDMGVVFYDQMAAASAGISERVVKATDLLAQGIQHSAQAISSVVGALKAMWEFYSSGMYDEVMASRGLVMEIAQSLIEFGREVFDLFAAAASGVTKKQVEAAQLLSTGITASTSAISATLKLVQDILQASFDPSFIDALFGDTRGRVEQIALALIDFGKFLFERFAAAGAGVSQRAVEAATRLSSGIKAASDGIKAATDSLKLLLDVAGDPSQVQALLDTQVRNWVLTISAALISLGRTLVDQFAAAGMTLGSQAVAAATRLSSGVKAAADGLKAAGESLKLLLGVAGDPSQTQGLFDGKLRDWLLAIASALAQLAVDLSQIWGQAGAQLGSQVVAAATRLTSGIKAAADGIKSTVEALGLLEGVAATGGQTTDINLWQPGNPAHAWLLGIGWALSQLALDLAQTWGDAGAKLGSVVVEQATRLSAGIKAAADGLKSVIDALRLLEGAAVTGGTVTNINLWQPGNPMHAWLLAIGHALGQLALDISQDWGTLGGALGSTTASGAQRLASGIDAASKGISSVIAALRGLVEAASLINVVQSALPDGSFVYVNSWLAHVAALLTTEWGALGNALGTTAVAGAQALASGADAVSKGILAMTSVLRGLVDSVSAIDNLQAALPDGSFVYLNSWFAHVANLLVTEWGGLGNALSTSAVSGAVALSNGIEAVSKGIAAVTNTMRLLVDSLALVEQFAAAFPTEAYVRGIVVRLGWVAEVMASEWGRIGVNLSGASTAGASALASGVESVSKGISSVTDAMRSLLSSSILVEKFALAFPTQAAVEAVVARLGWVAEVMASTWGEIGTRLNTASTAGATALTNGISSVNSGLTAVVSVMQTLLTSLDTLKAFGERFPDSFWIMVIVARLAGLAKEITEDWGLIGAQLSEAAASGATALTTGIQAAAQGIQTVLDTAKLLTKPPQLPPLGKGPGSISEYISNLAKWALDVIQAIQDGLGDALPTVTLGMKGLNDSLGACLSIIKDTLDLAKLLTKPPTPPDLGKQGDPGSLDTFLDNLIKWAIAVSKRVKDSLGKIVPELTAGMQGLRDTIAASLSIIKDTLDTAALLVKPPALPDLGMPGDPDSLDTQIGKMVEWAIAVSKRVSTASEAVPALTEGMKNLQDRIGSALSILKDGIEAIKVLTNPPGIPPMGENEHMGLHLYIDHLTLWAIAVASDVDKAASEGDGVPALSDSMKHLQDRIGSALSIIKDGLDAIKALTKPPDIPDLDTTLVGGRTLRSYIHDLITWAADVSEEEQTAAGDVSVLSEGMKALQDKVGASLSIVKDSIDVIKALVKPPDIPNLDTTTVGSGTLRTYIHNLIVWAKDVAKEAQDAASTDVPALSEGMKALQDGIGSSLSIIKDTLDLFKSLAGYKETIKSPPSKEDAANDPILKAVRYLAGWAKLISETAVDVMSTSTLSSIPEQVKAVVDGVSATLSSVKDVLDIFTALAEMKGIWTDAPQSEAAIASDPTLSKVRLLGGWAKAIAEAFVAITSTSSLSTIPDQAKAVVDGVSNAVSAVKDVLDLFTSLAKNETVIPKVTSLDAAPYAEEIEKLIKWATYIAAAFVNLVGVMGQEGQLPAITEAGAKAAATLAGVVGNAVGSVKDALDVIQALAENETAIPNVPALGQSNAVSIAINQLIAWGKWTAEQFTEAAKTVNISEAVSASAGALADMVGKATSTIKDALDTIQSLLEFSWTEKFNTVDSDGKPKIDSRVHNGLPAVDAIKSAVKQAIALAVMIADEARTAAEAPENKAVLDKAAQEATKALDDVAGHAFSVIKGILDTIKGLMEFKIENGPGMVNTGQGNYLYSQGSSTPGIPAAGAVTSRVQELMAALKAILESVKTGMTALDLGSDVAALQTKLGQVLTIVQTAAAVIKAVHDLVGTTGNGKLNLDIHIAVAFDIPDLVAIIGKVTIPTVHIPIVWDVPPLPDGSGGTNGSGTGIQTGTPPTGSGNTPDTPTNASGSGGTTTNITINQTVPPAIAADPAGTLAQLKALYA